MRQTRLTPRGAPYGMRLPVDKILLLKSRYRTESIMELGLVMKIILIGPPHKSEEYEED